MQLSGRLAALGFRQHRIDLWVNGGWELRDVQWREYRKSIDADGRQWVHYGEPKLRRRVWRLANRNTIVHSEDTLSAMVDWLEKMAWRGADQKGDTMNFNTEGQRHRGTEEKR